MSEARTKLDILYQNVLGDVKEILDHMDALKAGLPNAFDGAMTDLKNQTGSLTSTAEKINQTVNDITKRIDSYVSSAALHAGDAARVEIRQSVAESLNTLIYESLLPIINRANSNSNDSLEKLVNISTNIENKITSDAGKAISTLNAAISSLKVAVELEREKIEENKWQHLKFSAYGALVGTVVAIGMCTLLFILLKH